METDHVVFDPQLWNEAELRLSSSQASALRSLQGTLTTSKLSIAETIRLALPEAWQPGEIRQLEREILNGNPRKAVKASFEVLAKVVQRHGILTGVVAPPPRSITPVRLERNPFHSGVQHAAESEAGYGMELSQMEDLHSELLELLRKRVAEVTRMPQRPEDALEAARLYLALGIVSGILHFHLLHESMIVALIDVMAKGEDGRLPLGPGSNAWILSLPWQGEQDTEGRLLVPDIMTEQLLLRVPKSQVEAIFFGGVNVEQTGRGHHKRIMTIVGPAVRQALGKTSPDLKAILKAAQHIAYLNLPASIAAIRCRKVVTHSARPAALSRILGVPGAGAGEDDRSSGKVLLGNQEPPLDDREIQNETEVQPEWLHDLRRAFQQHKEEIFKSLRAISDRGMQPATRFAEFGIHLLSNRGPGGKPLAVSSAKRYCLLTARRCGTRLGDIDPKTLRIDELEDLYREALEDDWDDDIQDIKVQTFRRNKRATILALSKFHKFLDVGELDELKASLRNRGLIPVDANFITIDEYQKILDHIAGPDGPDDPHWREVMEFTIILAFRCGLRRREVLYLAIDDFDAADHLQIRKNELRELKTSNAMRSIPLQALLSEHELSRFRSYVRRHRIGAMPNKHQGINLMFPASFQKPWAPIDEGRLVADIHAMLRNQLGDRTLRLHHLRHSCATLLAAKLFSGSDNLLGRMFLNHPLTVRWLADRDDLRLQLFGTSEITALDLQAIALLLGHGSPEVTLEHYIHSMDWYGSGELF